jgi:hypothetical protein
VLDEGSTGLLPRVDAVRREGVEPLVIRPHPS